MRVLQIDTGPMAGTLTLMPGFSSSQRLILALSSSWMMENSSSACSLQCARERRSECVDIMCS